MELVLSHITCDMVLRAGSANNKLNQLIVKNNITVQEENNG